MSTLVSPTGQCRALTVLQTVAVREYSMEVGAAQVCVTGALTYLASATPARRLDDASDSKTPRHRHSPVRGKPGHAGRVARNYAVRPAASITRRASSGERYFLLGATFVFPPQTRCLAGPLKSRICAVIDTADLRSIVFLGESTNVCRLWTVHGFSFRSDFGAIAIPVDLEQIGGQALGHRGDDVLAIIGAAGSSPGSLSLSASGRLASYALSKASTLSCETPDCWHSNASTSSCNATRSS